ncbi:MAG TPA: AAA family ATPase [Actinocrinis sp.]|nr:AAA family ATPase [Actinocrinis sp.]
MELFERTDALSRLARLRDDVFAGRGGTVLVGGPVAVGKSALLDEFTTLVAQAGGLTLTAVAAEAEKALPLSVPVQFLLGPALPAEGRERIAALLAEGVQIQWAEPAAAGAETRRLTADGARIADGLCAGLIELSAAAPLAIVVDDVHHADPASLDCLAYLVRRVRDARIAVVLGHADHDGNATSAFRLGVLGRPHSSALDLRPLSQAGIEALAATRLDPAAAAAWAGPAHQASGGNPLLAVALLEDQRINDPQAGPFAVGDGYTRAVLTCLRRGGERMLAAAQGTAVLGGRPGLDGLLGLDPGSAAAAAADLERAGLFEGAGFRHPAAAAAVLADMDPARRAALHERAAEIGYSQGLAATTIAEHLRAARRATAPWAVPTLDEAARQALIEGRVAAAIDYLSLACADCDDQTLRAKLTTTLVRAAWRRSPAEPTQYLEDLLGLSRSGHLAGADCVVLAKALLWHGRIGDAAQVLRDLSGSAAAFDPETVTELRATRPWLRSSFAPLLEFVPEAGPGEPRQTALDTTEVRRRFEASAALDEVLTKGPSERVVEEAERILRAARLDGMGMDTVESALLALTYAEHPHRAAPWCDKLIEQAVAREAPSRQARLSAIRSEISLRQGDLLGAEQQARASLDIISESGWGVALGSCLGSLLTALSAMGRQEEAAEMLTHPVPDAMLQSRFGLHYLRARGRYHLAADDLDGALADFMYCGDLMGRWELDAPGLVAWRTDAAEALLALGERDQARRLLEEQMARCDRRLFPRTHGNTLRLYAASLEPRQRPALLRRAADVLQESGDRYSLALALRDLTASYHELGESRRARVIGRQAWSIAGECHAEPLTRYLSADAAQPEPKSAADSVVLSEAEQRVADLVILGHTNREIAKWLYITVSTVEQHLTRAYRKLGVTRRVDLAIAVTAQRERNRNWNETVPAPVPGRPAARAAGGPRVTV